MTQVAYGNYIKIIVVEMEEGQPPSLIIANIGSELGVIVIKGAVDAQMVKNACDIVLNRVEKQDPVEAQFNVEHEEDERYERSE